MAHGKLRDDRAAHRQADKAGRLGDVQGVEEGEEFPVVEVGIVAARGAVGPAAAKMIELQDAEAGHAQGFGVLVEDESRCRETVHHDDQRRAFGTGQAVMDLGAGHFGKLAGRAGAFNLVQGPEVAPGPGPARPEREHEPAETPQNPFHASLP